LTGNLALNRFAGGSASGFRLFSLSDFIVIRLAASGSGVTAAAFFGELGYQMQLVWVRSR